MGRRGQAPIKAIAAAGRLLPEAVDAEVEAVFGQAGGGRLGFCLARRERQQRLRLLHKAIVDREEQGETLSRLLPGGLAEKLRRDGRQIGETERVTVTVLMSDIRSYSTIAEHADPSQLGRGSLTTHRGGHERRHLSARTAPSCSSSATPWMAVFSALVRTRSTTPTGPSWRHWPSAMEKQSIINRRWEDRGTLPPFGLGFLGLLDRTGMAAAALLGSEERLEYTLVGDTVGHVRPSGSSELADAGEIVVSQGTVDALGDGLLETVALLAQLVKGRARHS